MTNANKGIRGKRKTESRETVVSPSTRMKQGAPLTGSIQAEVVGPRRNPPREDHVKPGIKAKWMLVLKPQPSAISSIKQYRSSKTWLIPKKSSFF